MNKSSVIEFLYGSKVCGYPIGYNIHVIGPWVSNISPKVEELHIIPREIAPGHLGLPKCDAFLNVHTVKTRLGVNHVEVWCVWI